VLMDPDLGCALFAEIPTFAGRCRLRAVCQSLLACSRAPGIWKHLDLGEVCTEGAWHVINCDDGSLFTRAAMESLAVTLRVPSDVRCSRSVLPVGPQLVELKLTGSLVKLGMLRDAFAACGGTLLRLGLTGVRFWGTATIAGGHGYSYEIREQRLGEAFDKAPEAGGGTDLFEPLGALRVLVAREVDTVLDTRRDPREQRLSVGMVAAVQRCCPYLEELVLGWGSEFDPRLGGPQAQGGFAAPVWAAQVPDLDEGGGQLSNLKAAVLPGHILLDPRCLHSFCGCAPPLETLDISSSQSLDDTVLTATLPLVARTLRSLNVRGTSFGDATAAALAAAGTKLARLNASCTMLTGRGLAVLSAASDRLHYLDLCYADKLATADVLACVHRHGERLTMLGVGGFADLTTSLVRELLQESSATMLHFGCGGCEALDGTAMLEVVAELCPQLRALNMHRLTRCTIDAFRTLLNGCPGLVSLDCHGCDIEGSPGEDEMDDETIGEQLAAKERWMALGQPYDVHFHESSVIRSTHPLVRLQR